MSSGGMARGGPTGATSEGPSERAKSIVDAGKGAGGRGLGAATQPLKKTANSTPQKARRGRPTGGRTGAGFSATMGALKGVKLS